MECARGAIHGNTMARSNQFGHCGFKLTNRRTLSEKVCAQRGDYCINVALIDAMPTIG
jgi:hypothetical protein